MTYLGHTVAKTLIRCHFSPLATTGGAYLLTGSFEGTAYIYDALTGDVVQQLQGHAELVRDVSWHPTRPLIATGSWDRCVRVHTYESGALPAAGQVDQPAGATVAGAGTNF